MLFISPVIGAIFIGRGSKIVAMKTESKTYLNRNFNHLMLPKTGRSDKMYWSHFSSISYSFLFYSYGSDHYKQHALVTLNNIRTGKYPTLSYALYYEYPKLSTAIQMNE